MMDLLNAKYVPIPSDSLHSPALVDHVSCSFPSFLCFLSFCLLLLAVPSKGPSPSADCTRGADKPCTELVRDVSLLRMGKDGQGLILSARSIDLPLQFLPNPNASNVIVSGSRLVWISDGRRSFFADPPMGEGIYNMSLECIGGWNWLEFGLVLKELINNLSCAYLNVSGACSLYRDRLFCGVDKVAEKEFFCGSGKLVMSLELDANQHVLYFFVNSKQIPYLITDVPPHVHFAVSNYYRGVSVELKSLSRLAAPSVNASLVCTSFKWR